MEHARFGAMRSRSTLPLLCAAALWLLAVGGSVLSLPRTTAVTLWKQYRVLLVDRGVTEDEVLRRLSAAGFPAVLAESTEPVQVSDWAGLKTIPLRAAREALLPGDPRRDAYIDNLSEWFAGSIDGSPCRIYYVPTRGQASLGSRVAAALRGVPGPYLLPDAAAAPDGRGRWPAFALAAAIFLVLCLYGALPRHGATIGRTARIRVALRAALLSPWLFMAAFGGEAAALALLWGAALVDCGGALLVPLLEYRRSADLRQAWRSLVGRGRPTLALALMALATLIAVPAYWLALLLAVVGSLAASAALAVTLARPKRPARLGFVPLPLGSVRQRGELPAAVAAALAVVLWLAARLFAPSLAPAQASPVRALLPLPTAMAGALFPDAAEAIERIRSEDTSTLPGLADWLAHRAHEEALPYLVLGAPRPDPFAEVTLPRPKGDAIVLVFNRSWAKTAYRSIPPQSVEGLLAAQGRALQVRALPLPPTRDRPLAPTEVILYIILLIPPLRRIIAAIPAPRQRVQDPATHELRQEA